MHTLKEIANLHTSHTLSYFQPSDVNVECKCHFKSKETYYQGKLGLNIHNQNCSLPLEKTVTKTLQVTSVLEKCPNYIYTFYFP